MKSFHSLRSKLCLRFVATQSRFVASVTRVSLTLTLALSLVSCTTTGGGALTGAMFGGVIGSSIGGIGGGWRGSNVGTLVGMAVGAGTGAAVGAAAEAEQRAQYEADREYVREHYRSLHRDDVYGADNSNSNSQSRQTPSADTGYSADPVYNDVITFTPSDTTQITPPLTPPKGADTISISNLSSSPSGRSGGVPIEISNARFINDAGTTHIDKGELVKVSFELRNQAGHSLYNVVPLIQETTGNKHLLISPSTLVERIPAKGALRYTAYISAEKSLKTGTAHFVLSVLIDDTTVSNTIEFDVPLN